MVSTTQIYKNFGRKANNTTIVYRVSKSFHTFVLMKRKPRQDILVNVTQCCLNHHLGTNRVI